MSINCTVARIDNGEEPEIVNVVIGKVETRLDIILGDTFLIIYDIDFHNIETHWHSVDCMILINYIKSVFIDVDELLQSKLIRLSWVEITLVSDASFET